MLRLGNTSERCFTMCVGLSKMLSAPRALAWLGDRQLSRKNLTLQARPHTERLRLPISYLRRTTSRRAQSNPLLSQPEPVSRWERPPGPQSADQTQRPGLLQLCGCQPLGTSGQYVDQKTQHLYTSGALQPL